MSCAASNGSPASAARYERQQGLRPVWVRDSATSTSRWCRDVRAGVRSWLDVGGAAVTLNGIATVTDLRAMPPWKALSDVEIASVITYTRHAFGNNAAEGIVQPRTIAGERK